jgi:hypothetical protein
MPQNPEPRTKSQQNRIPGLIEHCHGIESYLHTVLIHLALHKNFLAPPQQFVPIASTEQSRCCCPASRLCSTPNFILEGHQLPPPPSKPSPESELHQMLPPPSARVARPVSPSPALRRPFPHACRQSGFLSSPRSRRKKLFSDWCSIVRL